jgi:hypothetical protein
MFCDGSSTSYEEMLSVGLEMAMPRLTGDFYHEPDEVTRGVTLFNSGASDFSQNFGLGGKDFWQSGYDHLLDKAWTDRSETVAIALANEHRCNALISRFQEGDAAPDVPDDSFLQLGQTTIVVNDASAAHIGNCMLDFFAVEAAGFISKVNPTKFTIKAEVCVDGLSCETKVRIYRKADGQHIVEMQRRSGDSIAFHHLYRWASQHTNSLNSSYAVQSDANGAAVKPPQFAGVPSEPLDVEPEASLAPLLDLASSGNIQLQAEAVQELLRAAQDVHVAVQLCTPHAFMVFQSLLQLVCFSVAEPLARLLCCLATLPETEAYFTDRLLLQTMIEKAGACAPGQLVAEQLAKAVCHTITGHARELSPGANRELTVALTEKLRDGAPAYPVHGVSTQSLATVHYLQESLHTLNMLQECF